MANTIGERHCVMDFSKFSKWRNVYATLVASAVSLAMGCSFKPSTANTYPCDFGVYSKFRQTIEIIECEGMGSVYPDGLIVPTHGPAPTKTFFFPRQKRFPERIRIRWKIGTENFSQEIVFPQVEKGSEGMLCLELSQDNVWNLIFEKETVLKVETKR